MSKQKKSPWIPLFFRKSTTVFVCDGCDRHIEAGSVIFYFPKLHKHPLSRKGTVYCYKCFVKKVTMMTLGEVL